MKPTLGIALEVAGAAALLLAGLIVPTGVVFALYVAVAELLMTYLVHCPAHYIVGSLFGIRFRKMVLGRTTLARVLPQWAAGYARLLPVLTLVTDKQTVGKVSRRKLAAMYASGTVASVSSALIIAAWSTFAEPLSFSALAWAIGLAYLVFDLVFSPKSGDLARALSALGS